MKNVVIQTSLAVAGLVCAGSALADQFHYNNVIVGDRAMGLGGAYTGVSDDASGVVYNPGGLGFAQSNDISGSANAFYNKKVTYKEAAYGKDYQEVSSGTIAPFFGGLQKLDKISDGLVAAFGMYTRDSNLMEQNDKIANFHRAVNHKAATTYIGAAVAKRIGATLSVGFGLNYIMVDELTQDFQFNVSGWTKDGVPTYRLYTGNNREALTGRAIEPTLGVQAALGTKVSVGAMVRMPLKLSQKRDSYVDGSLFYAQIDETTHKGKIGADGMPEWDGENGGAFKVTSESDKPLGTLPWEVRAGLAWFASPRLMWALDLDYVTSVTDAEVNAAATDYNKDAVFNINTGLEYYLTPAFPLRMGFFTNYDARPAVDESQTNQRDSIDYYGFPVFLGWVQSNSQIALGCIYQKGSGKAQKIASSKTVQKVDASMTTLAFSASHNF